MPNLTINKRGQCSVTIPKELIEALGWKSGECLLISKAPGQTYLTIENLAGAKLRGKKT